MVEDQLGSKSNWVDSNDLAMMFEGTYQSPFYRQLHRLLHADLELRQRLAALPASPDVAARTALNRLDEEWAELARTEAQYRSAAPTPIPNATPMPAAPDLSREWN